MKSREPVLPRMVAWLSAATFGFIGLASAESVEWHAWNIHPEGYPNTVAMDKFAELIADKAEGKIPVKNFHSGGLGSQTDASEQVRAGKLDVGNFNPGPIASEANVVSFPFILKDMQHIHRALDGPAGALVSASMAEKGLIALAWYDSSARSFHDSKKAINTPDDAKGLKIRVMNNPPEQGAGEHAVDDLPSTIVLPSEDLVGQIRARPLFNPTRRPLGPVPLQKPAAQPKKAHAPKFQLAGTMLVDDQWIALLQHPEKHWLKLQVGQTLDGWQLIDIDRHRVRLAGDGHQVALDLRGESAGQAAGRHSDGNARMTASDDEGQPMSEMERRWRVQWES